MKGVLVDTSVWVGHFRVADQTLESLLLADQVYMHPWVLGELCCGTPPDRHRTLTYLALLRPCQQASLREVQDFVERERLYGLGCGLVDLTLLCSTLLTPGLALWTHDRRLRELAERFGIEYETARQ